MPSPARRGQSEKKYDESYFRRWYGNPRTRVTAESDRFRRVALVVAVAEYVLERRIRSVLDVGCGEGRWGEILRQLRPGLRYVGVDSSEYIVRRHGRARGIIRGTFADLESAAPRKEFDVVVASDMMHYLTSAELRAGIGALARRTGGVAYLHLFTSRDEVEGDLEGMILRGPAFYARLFRSAGLVHIGMQLYCRKGTTLTLTAMERTLK